MHVDGAKLNPMYPLFTSRAQNYIGGRVRFDDTCMLGNSFGNRWVIVRTK